MRPVLAIVAGFVLSLGMFAGGIVLATYTLAAKPVAVQAGPEQDMAELWTAEPRTVDPAEQDFERLAAAPVSTGSETAPVSEQPEIIVASADAEPEIDGFTTSALPPADEPAEQPRQPQALGAHHEWCSSRYRSYRADTNSYRPYSGGERACVSPYWDGEGAASSSSGVVQASVGTGQVQMASSHVQDCFARYRSYRVEDNTYQPYGGGPRRQCR